MSTFYLTLFGSGMADGPSIANPTPVSTLPQLVGAAELDGQVLLLADQGADQLTGFAIALAGGGTDGHSVTIRGVDNYGNTMCGIFLAARAGSFDPADFYSRQGFRLANGAGNLKFSDLSASSPRSTRLLLSKDVEQGVTSFIYAMTVDGTANDGLHG